MTERHKVTGITIEADSVVIKGTDFDALCALARENEQLRQGLSLAEKGLANATQEIGHLKREYAELDRAAQHDIEKLTAIASGAVTDNELLRKALEAANAELEATGIELIEARAQVPQKGDNT
jgi:hypothetical protein